MSKSLTLTGAAAALALLSNCASMKPKGDQIVVSVSDQRLVLMDEGAPVKSYPVSTSKFGLGSKSRSHKTPLGKMYVHQKIGDGARSGAVFKSRRPTGEVLRPNAPGRDPIVSRILWLEGLERSNSNTKERMIYIHGTPEERTIGRPASYGCIRMKSRDVIDLYARVDVGTGVYVKRSHLRVAEIPSSDRSLLASARTREQPAPVMVAAAPPREKKPAVVASRPPREKKPVMVAAKTQREVFAAAAPSVRRVAPRDRVVSPSRGQASVPAPPSRPPAPPADMPKRRGAFTKL